MKKLLLITLGLLIALPTIARDFTYTYEGQTLTYTVISEEDKTVETKKGYTDGNYIPGNNVSGTLIIPSTVVDNKGVKYNVISIGSCAFQFCSDLSTVIIPNSVTSIGFQAFYCCNGLTKVTIGNSVTSIGSSAFQGCMNLTSITIPNSVISIGRGAFSDCMGLTSMTIPNSVTTIGDNAFSNCCGLTSVTIPESVTSIGDDAFFGCSNLTKAEFASVEAMCKIEYKNYRSNPLYYAHNLWIDGKEVKDLVIPESVISIGDYAFRDCGGLTSVTIGNSVTSIGDYAFSGCTGLTKAEFPSIDAMCKIEYKDYSSNPLYYAHNLWIDGKELKDLLIPESVTAIRNYAFAGGQALTSVTIPKTVSSIGICSFHYCNRLRELIIADGTSELTFGKNAFNSTEIETLYCGRNCSGTPFSNFTSLKNLTIGNSVTSIGSQTFSLCSNLKNITIADGTSELKFGVNVFDNATIETLYYGRNCSGTPFKNLILLKNLTIGNLVTSIGNQAFSRCSGLKKLTIADGTSELKFGVNVFEGVEVEALYLGRNFISTPSNPFGLGLKNLTIGNSVTSIGDYAFSGCSGLTSVTIPESVTSIGYQAFTGCNGLTSVTVLSANPPVISPISWSLNTRETAWLNIPEESLEKYLATEWGNFDNIIAGKVKITYYTDGILKYRTFNIPDNPIAYVVKGNNYGELTDIQIPERFTDLRDPSTPVRYYVTEIAPDAFSYLKNLKSVSFSNRSVVTKIGHSAFRDCTGLVSVSIPDSVNSIGEAAFYGCTGLIKAEFANVEAMCKIFYENNTSNPLAYAHNLWIDGKEIKDLVIPESVTSIGCCAFFGCSGLTSVSIANSVTSIDSYSFYDCRGLTTVSIGNSVTSIGRSAFENCRGMTSVSIGNSVTSIGSYAFMNCNNLNSVIIPNSVNNLDKRAFSGCSGLTSVTIGNSVTSFDSETFFGCSGLKEVIFAEGTKPLSLFHEFFPGMAIETLYLGRNLYDNTTNVNPFYNNKTLKNLTIGNNVTSLNIKSFSGCTALTSLYLGSGIKTIDDYSFSGCTELKEVVLPPAVETIDASAFDGCTGLSAIIMGSEVKTIGENAFKGTKADNIYITALLPPTAPNTAFSNYSGKLYLQNRVAFDAYYDAFTCWDRFNYYEMIVPTSIEVSKTDLEGNPGEQLRLTAILLPSNVTLPQIFWTSSDPEVATVDRDGVVTIQTDKSVQSRAVRECKITARSLYADGPVAEVTIKNTGEIGSVEIIKPDVTESGDINFDEPYDVYTVSGQKVAGNLDVLTPGIYIVRQGAVAKKIAVN